MNKEEIRAIVKEAAKEATQETLTLMGFNVSEPLEMQKDLLHVRQWRIGCETTRKMTLKIFLTITIPSFLYFMFDAFKLTIAKMLTGG